MAYILKSLARAYVQLNDELSDDRTQDWFLMRSPIPGLALLGIYLYLVFRRLPAYMSTRKPYNLKIVIAVYNAFQIAACAYIVVQALRLGWATHYKLICQGVDFSNSPIALDYAYKVCYSYFIIKFIDLVDTFFFVLRKKQNQVTFLHVYHHTGMVMFAWAIVKWLPGGHGTLLVPINSFVHMIMYSYYLLTIWDESYKKSIWWKKHVTHLQLIQFTILIIHYSLLFVLPNCNYPRFVAYIIVPQNLFMLFLFGDFYYKTYIKKKNKN